MSRWGHLILKAFDSRMTCSTGNEVSCGWDKVTWLKSGQFVTSPRNRHTSIMNYICFSPCFSGKATGRRDLTSTCSPSGKAVPWLDAKPKCWPQSVVHQLLQAFVRNWGGWERQNYPSSIWNWSNARLGTSHSRQVWAVFWLQVRTNWVTSVAMQKWFLLLWLNLKIEKHIHLQILSKRGRKIADETS